MAKKEEYKYYSTQRLVDIGTYPKSRENPMIGFTNYDSRIPVEGGAFRAWGELVYGKPLTEKEAADYELRLCPCSRLPWWKRTRLRNRPAAPRAGNGRNGEWETPAGCARLPMGEPGGTGGHSGPYG